ncbi:MAG: patatin-like phospholipase family protein [Burkholderiaceae bacterium]
MNPWRRKNLHSISLGMLSLTGCTFGSGPNHQGINAPTAADVRQRLPGNPWALVLSSGGPRGFVHVGVIEALDEIGVRPDIVVGASVGALVATLYCSGISGKALREIALSLGPTQMARLSIGTSERFSGAPIATQVNIRVNRRRLQDLRPVCAVVARKQGTNSIVAFTEGNAGVAVQASTAIEGRFTPVSIHDTWYVDPDQVVPMPVREARRLGAARVISVDASAHETQAPAGAERFRESDQLKRRLTEPDARASDLNLHPKFGYWVSLSEEFRIRCIRAGYEQTLQMAGKIRQLANV